jgi:hypothetical protein
MTMFVVRRQKTWMAGTGPAMTIPLLQVMQRVHTWLKKA